MPQIADVAQVSVLLNGDIGLHIDRTRLTNESERLLKQPEFLEKLAETMKAAQKIKLNQLSTFGKLMARIDKDSQSNTPERLAIKAA